MRISLNKQTILLLTIITGIVITASITYMTSVGTCFASDSSTGAYTSSNVFVAVTGSHVGYGTLTVSNINAPIPVAAHYVIIRDGKVVRNSWFGVGPGDSLQINFDNLYVHNYVEGKAEGYFDVLDSRADAKAYWSTYCPLCTPLPEIEQ